MNMYFLDTSGLMERPLAYEICHAAVLLFPALALLPVFNENVTQLYALAHTYFYFVSF